jgi:low affinity Fe/Cu permease
MNSHWFTAFASRVAAWAGRPVVFAVAFGAILLWAIAGPIFDFSEAWQLTVNTATTIVTFLMVFVIQNTQNRDSRAMQIKLDELIRTTQHAHNALLDLEELDEEELDEFRKRYIDIARKARELGLADDEGTPKVVLPGTKLLAQGGAKPKSNGRGRAKKRK